MTQKEGSNAKRVVKCDFHGCCHGNQRWPEKRCHHGHEKIGLAHAEQKAHMSWA